MKIIRNPKRDKWGKILKRPVLKLNLDRVVGKILQRIQKYGDEAVKEYSLQFDKVLISDFNVSDAEIVAANNLVSNELKNAIDVAIRNIESFHNSQKQNFIKIETTEGVNCWQKAVAIEKVGLYIPGGTAPLFSTVLMLGIPAKIAGCSQIILCTPPDKNGNINPAILYAANKIGIKTIFKIGGVQAIAAMAYGTQTVPKVFKIFGPGNQYVTVAKQLVSRKDVAIDMPAGPSEVAVMADDSANPVFIASDLLSQAEHGVDSQVLLVACSKNIVEKVNEELEKQVALLPRKEIAIKALENSRAIILKDEKEMIDMINEYAPEHLIVSMKNYMEIADKIINAGSVFLGNYTPESAGDYASGTNHTLPTHGFAKAYNGVNLDSYVKKITYQFISKEGLQNIGNAIQVMAKAEELNAHANAVKLRLEDTNS